MGQIHVWGNRAAGAPLERETISDKAPGPDEVLIEVLYCGLCHSDLLRIDSERTADAPPAVSGHEVVGRIVAAGHQVDPKRIGNLVGLGFIAGTCRHCDFCLGGRQTLCADLESTIIDRPGGFASHVRAHQDWAIPLPKDMDPKTAGPLFCAGVTVFEPLFSGNISPTARVAVIGVGGLGHLALQICRAWGCHVTGISRSPSKDQEILNFGAHAVQRLGELDRCQKQFDLIINTSDHELDWDAVIGALAPQGCLHQLGLCKSPIPLKVFPFVKGNLSFRGSLTSTPTGTQRMLDFCSRHAISPKVELLPMAEINTAISRLRKGNVRYRFVLEGPA